MARIKHKPKILVIVGPTASGKSALAIRLAKKVDGEIVSADSRQVYKGLNIGSGKVTKREMRGVKHYLLDVADPKKTFTVIDFVKQAEKAIASILEKKKVPIVCGGTGFYIQALIDGLVLPNVGPNEALRKKLDVLDTNSLLNKLKKLDPKRYNTIDKNNRRRIIRAIEIATAFGKVPKLKSKSKYDPEFIGIKTEPYVLRAKIYRRLIARINKGLFNEVKNLHDKGLSWKRMEALGLEYKYVALFLQNKISGLEMLDQLERAIWHYAKRQMTWFGRDKRIRWVSATATPTSRSDRGNN